MLRSSMACQHWRREVAVAGKPRCYEYGAACRYGFGVSSWNTKKPGDQPWLFGLSQSQSQAVENIRHVVGVFFFLSQNVFENTAGGWVFVANVLDDFAIAIDRDALGNQVFHHHFL